jgi:hypothetical protein
MAGAQPKLLQLACGYVFLKARSRSAVKTKAKTQARKTNNQASFGGSLLKNNMEVEAAMEMQRHLDEIGVHIVCTIYV